MTPLLRLDPDEQGNAHLQALVRRLHPHDIAPFVEKLTKLPLRPRFHAYRELLIGVHLRNLGFDVRYELEVDDQTPDWCVTNESGRPTEIVDVLTLHQRNGKEAEIGRALRNEGLWSGWITVPPDHIYRKLNDKAGQYSRLSERFDAPYVLAVYGEFTASIAPSEIEHVLFARHGGWFSDNAGIAGLIYCRATSRPFEFEFTHYANPHAAHPSSLLCAAAAHGEA